MLLHRLVTNFQLKKDDAVDKKYRISVADMKHILDNQIRPDDIRKTASLVIKLIEVEKQVFYK